MAAGSMAKASTHEKVGHTGQGLWKHKGWQLPAYIQHVANDLKAKVGESRAIEMAVGIVKNWAAGHDGKGHKVSATTQAAAQKAVAEWEALKAKAKGSKASSAGKRLTEAEVAEIPDVTDEDLAQMAQLASGRLRLLEASGLPTTGPGAAFDLLLVEATTQRGQRQRQPGQASNADFESKHPRSGGRFIAKGSTGQETRAVQRRVGARVDGSFGDKTRAAVMRFQKQHGLKVDGVVGRQTVAALRGRRDAKRVKIGGLGQADLAFLRGHVRGKGRRPRSTTLVEAVAVGSLLDRVKGLEQGEHARLPDGGAVKHHATEDGRAVWTAGTPSRWSDSGMSWGDARRTPEEAVADAFTNSASSTDPASLGGTTRYGKYQGVTVNGQDATFHGVDHHGQPLVRIGNSPGEPTTTSWPALSPKRDRLVEAGAYDETLHPRGAHGKWAKKIGGLKVGESITHNGITVERKKHGHVVDGTHVSQGVSTAAGVAAEREQAKAGGGKPAMDSAREHNQGQARAKRLGVPSLKPGSREGASERVSALRTISDDELGKLEGKGTDLERRQVDAELARRGITPASMRKK